MRQYHGSCFQRVIGLSAVLCSGLLPVHALAQQTPLPGTAIPQFVDPLPVPDFTGGTPGTMESIIAGSNQETFSMCEFKSKMLPSTFTPAAPAAPYAGTYVWGYRKGAGCPAVEATAQPTYIGPVVVATRGTPTEIKFINLLPNTDSSKVLAWTKSTDQTLHWADPNPLLQHTNECAHSIVAGSYPSPACANHHNGSIPTVPHLHGGEVPPEIDGGPDAWFTNDGRRGHTYYSMTGSVYNEAIYRYPNRQEAAPLWFHDHALGTTRLNVHSGLAGAYILKDDALSLPSGLHSLGLQQGTAGPVNYTIPLVLQDRLFDTNGQLYFPTQGINPEHPYWVPEFFGNTNVVNGKVWPYLTVEARRYRFLIINGSHARTYQLKLADAPVWQIASDGGYLDKPVQITNQLTLMPGERADIIIDFSGLVGKRLILKNTGNIPFPNGASPNPSTDGRVMQFRVSPTTLAVDASYNPAQGTALRSPMVRLANPVTGMVAAGVSVKKVRQITLNEVSGPGGPLEVLVNNTKWDGSPSTAGTCRPDFTKALTECVSELPTEGDTELWEIINLTEDAHPIHVHLTAMQLMNRQDFKVAAYATAYGKAFPGGAYIPAYGPPLNYTPTSGTGPVGGNPNVGPYLQGPIATPQANEAGWKDTIVVYPGQVTRIAVRFAPTDTSVNVIGSFAFDPNSDQHGYVVHCHILDHEDNEMMRPTQIKPRAVERTYVKGIKY